MTFTCRLARTVIFSAARRCLTTSLSVLALAVVTYAQTSSVITGQTPPGVAPGSPANSYALSGFENINLFNGKLNFHLPLVQIGGRGQAGYTIPLTIEQHWNINRDCSGCAVYGPQDYPGDYWWNGIDPGYSPGAMIGRGISEVPTSGIFCNANETLTWRTLTRLTFIMPEGTEYELIDYLKGGAPQTVTLACGTGQSPPEQGVSRGKVFVTRDGTAATFISDTTIYDYNYNQNTSETQFYPSGYLLLKDGTRYRIANGFVKWMRDRNGNAITFTYNAAGTLLTQVQDSVGRRITFGSGGTPCGANNSCSWIAYSGFGGAPRSIKIYRANLGDTFNGTRVLRDDYQLPLKTTNQLFPEFNNPLDVKYGEYNPSKVAAVELPDGRQYKFQYNYHGELARVVLPTGGAFEYDWEGAAGNETSIFDWGNTYGAMVYRRVKTRRVYSSGTTLEGVTTYTVSSSATLNGAPNGHILVDSKDPSGNVLAHEEHYFHGSPLDTTGSPYDYPAWNVGLGRQTDYFKADGTTLLRRVVQTWQQGPPPSSWPSSPGYNPHVVETITTLATASPGLYRVAKQSAIKPNGSAGFDQYNNLTDVYEYDFGTAGGLGTAVPGSLLRHTHTDFLTTNNVNGAAYDTVNPSTSAPDANATVHLRSLPTQQWVSADANGTVKKSLTSFEYDDYADDAKHAALVGRTGISGLCTTYDPAGQCSSLNAADYKTRGNGTSITRHLLSAAGAVTGSVTAYSQFDVAGNVVKGIDARGNFSTLEYDDKYGSPDEGGLTNSPPQELVQLGDLVSYALPTEITNSKGHVTRTQYDYYLGAPVKTQDPNEVISSTSYDDPLDRPRQSISAIGTAQANQTTITYLDSARTVRITSDLNDYDDNLLKSEEVYDGLGRTTESRVYESSTAFIRTRQGYDAIGRVGSVTNPYRTTQDPTYGVATTLYDALGRVQTVTTSDGAAVQTDYDGTRVMMADQAGKKRVIEMNALGQITNVWEIKPADSSTVTVSFGGQNLTGYLTHYDYDTLGHLSQVTQDVQTRSFAYDSLSRLTSATNPEGGAVQYQYDANGNLILKIDPRPRAGSLTLSTCSIPYSGGQVATCYKYDPLNRIETRSYNDGTPNVTYAYDTAANGKGRLATVDSSVSTYIYTAYDALGRVRGSSQTTDGVIYQMPDYQYNLVGGLISEQYPSGRVVKTDYDVAGRVAGVRNQATGLYYVGGAAADAANRIQYAASGAASAVKLGNGLWEHTDFNSRLQPRQIGLGTSAADSNKLRLDYDYGVVTNGTLDTTKNNGNLQGQTITVPGAATPFVQTYEYDELNRLKKAEEKSGTTSNWKQLYAYDRYGNRSFAAGTTSPDFSQTPNDPATGLPIDPARNPVFDPLTNRIKVTASGQGDYGYDEAGNLLCQPGRTCVQGQGAPTPYYAYDADNRVKSAAGGDDNGGTSYTYDGDGRRIKKTTFNGEVTVFVYNAVGKLVAEYSNQVAYKGTRYLTQDRLGSTRVVTDAQGNAHSTNGASGSRHDYFPFGEEVGADIGGRTTNQGYVQFDGVRQRFTSEERDPETGLDYFGTRYYSSAMGRFTSPDIPFTGQWEQDPQSWNLYTYVGNNPLKYIDPTGMYRILPDGTVVGDFDGECQDGIGCWSEQNQRWELPNNQKGKENDPFQTITDSENNFPTVAGFVGPLPAVQAAPKAASAVARSGGRFATGGIGRLFGVIGWILFNPSSTGCGASPGMVSDGNGGCRYDPARDPRLTYTPPPQGDLPIFGAKRVRSKNQRARWIDDEGNIYEWDSQHGRVEKYNKRGKHLGEFDPNTGEQTKPAKPGRTTEP